MIQWLQGEFITLAIMSIALGTDAFSVSIGLGMAGIRKLHALYVSLLVGSLHVLLPVVGMFAGRYLRGLIGDATARIGAAILAVLGLQMLYFAFRGKDEEDQSQQLLAIHRWWPMVVFAFGVSFDALSAGFGLGLFDTPVLVASFMIGATGFLMTLCGVFLGRRLGPHFGKYGHAVGGAVLVALGSYFFVA